MVALLKLPVDVICGNIFPHLSICDLQALDTAYTNRYLRFQVQQVWKSYQYDSLGVELRINEMKWLCEKGAQIISAAVSGIQQSLFTGTATLKKLHLKLTHHSSFLFLLAANCPKLEELHVFSICGPNVDDAFIAVAQNRCLKSLCIGRSNVTDAMIQILCSYCPHLEHIGLHFCDMLTDASLMDIASTYPHLQSFQLHSNIVTDNGLTSITKKCHELRSVDLRGRHFTSRGFTALWEANPQLMEVDISYNDFTYDVIIHLVQCCPLLQKLIVAHCSNFADTAATFVAEHCPQLKSLDISSCCSLSDASLIALGQHCPELKSINISQLENISDVGIAALAAGCPLLQEFSAVASNITDAGVVALARGCRDLRKINLGQVQSIGFTAVSSIAKTCPMISELYLSECGGVNVACVHDIGKNCRNLTVLNVKATNASNDLLRTLTKPCRMLRTINLRSAQR